MRTSPKESGWRPGLPELPKVGGLELASFCVARDLLGRLVQQAKRIVEWVWCASSSDDAHPEILVSRIMQTIVPRSVCESGLCESQQDRDATK